MNDDIKVASKVWDIDPKVFTHLEQNVQKTKYKHGLFASIPLICKGVGCPYGSVCSIPATDRVLGNRCVIEIASIISRFDSWCKHFGIKNEGEYFNDEDLVDVSLIRDLVDNEIQIIRAENKVAMSGDFISKTIADVDKKCNEHYENIISPESQFKLNLLDKRYKILQLLNSTRKDKKDEQKVLNDSEKVFDIYNKIASRVEAIKESNGKG